MCVSISGIFVWLNTQHDDVDNGTYSNGTVQKQGGIVWEGVNKW